MSRVITASKLSIWSGTGCRSDERWLTLHGPRGAAQHVRLVDDAKTDLVVKLQQDKEALEDALIDLLSDIDASVYYMPVEDWEPCFGRSVTKARRLLNA